MKNLNKKIQQINLTKTEKKIAEFFLEQNEKIFLMTSKEISKILKISDTSIIRFIKHLGFKNFKDFRKFGKSNIQSRVSSIPQFVENLEKLKENSIEQLMLNQMNTNISNLFAKNSIQLLNKIVDTIYFSNAKYIVGLKSTAGLSNFLGIRLAFMLENVYTYYHSDTVLFNSIKNINSKDILILFDYPSYSSEMILLCKIAKQKGAKLILISDSMYSPCSSYADLEYNVKIKGISTFHSLISSQLLVEYILNTISKRLSKKEKGYFVEWKKLLQER